LQFNNRNSNKRQPLFKLQKMLISNKLHWFTTAFFLGLFTFLFFQFVYPYHLFFKEQVQLFLYTPDYFFSYLCKPAWLGCYLGDYLTQFYYLRGGGATVLSFLILIEWLLIGLTIKHLTHSKIAHLWALLPVCIDITLQCSILHEASFSVSLILTLCTFLCFRQINVRWISICTGLIITPLTYWFSGSAAFIFPLLVILDSYKKIGTDKLLGIAMFLVILVTPFILRPLYLLTIEQAYIFPAIQKSSLLLLSSLVVVYIFASISSSFEDKHKTITLCVLGLIMAFSLVSGIAVFADFDQESEFALDSETYFGNTDKVLSLARSSNIESRNSSYYHNIALAKKGWLADSLMYHYQPAVYGLMLPVAPGEGWITIVFSNEVYFLVGDMNLAQHSAMLGNTFSTHNRSSRMLKRLSEINLVNGDTAAADKYLRILAQTRFHREWAVTRLDHGPTTTHLKLIDEKQKLVPYSDTLRKANDFCSSLSFLVNQNPKNSVALEYLLCYHLLNKDLDSFVHIYNLYAKNRQQHIPNVYQEALLIYFLRCRTSTQVIAGYELDPQIIKSFIEYTKRFDQSNGNMQALQHLYSKTYWYYYHFATIET
jgi:hypothetical protein